MGSRVSSTGQTDPVTAPRHKSASSGQVSGTQAPTTWPPIAGLPSAPARGASTAASRRRVASGHFPQPPARGADGVLSSSFMHVGSDSSDSDNTIRPAKEQQGQTARIAESGVPEITAELQNFDTALAGIRALARSAQHEPMAALAGRLAQQIDERYRNDSHQAYMPQVSQAYAGAIFSLPVGHQVSPACSLASHLDQSGIRAVPQLIPGFARSALSLSRGSDRVRALCNLAPYLQDLHVDEKLRDNVFMHCLEATREVVSPTSEISRNKQALFLVSLAEEIPMRPEAQRLEAFNLVAAASIQQLLPRQNDTAAVQQPLPYRPHLFKTLASAVHSLAAADCPIALKRIVSAAAQIEEQPDLQDRMDLHSVVP